MPTSADTFALAAQYHATGNPALAEQYCLSILGEEPNHADALRLLGVITHEKGDLNQALVYLNKSVTANGANAATWRHLGDVLLAAGDLRGGVTHYEQALRLRPDFAEGYITLGRAWAQLGEWARAVLCFRQATRLLPSFAQGFSNLGTALRAQGKWAEAVQAFERARELRPDSPDIAYNIGITRHLQGQLDQAVAHYREALRLKPANAADMSNSLATAFKEQGLLDEAGDQFQGTLKLRPDHAMALYNLSELAAVGRYSFTPEDLGRIKTFLTSGRCSPLEQRLYALTLGNVLDQQGAYDEAFRYYQAANDLQKHLLKKRDVTFDAGAHEAMIDRIIADQGRSYFERVRKWGTTTESPIFIIGMPRSGSTLIEQILASHPKVFGAGEIGNVYRFIAQVTAEKKAAMPDQPAAPAPPRSDRLAGDLPPTAQLLPNVRATREFAADYLRRLVHLGGGGGETRYARVTIKNLENFLALGVIATLFSQARVIHCRRDPVDVCLSCYFHNIQDVPFTCSLKDIGAYYRAYEKLMAHWSQVLPVKIHEVRYEQLVHNQEKVSRDLLSYCGLDWDERCLAFWKTRRVVQTASSIQVRQPIFTHAIGRWRHYQSHLSPLFQALEMTR
jgi:tetratricopeptide (TPR) repeat protein